jgi:pimeloyl-ACP methyl ester carboxylesterase
MAEIVETLDRQTKASLETIEEYIRPLQIGSLRGRVLRLPAVGNPVPQREIIMLYGQHASLERMAGIAAVLQDYGTVTVPDLPGFGGMPSFFTVGQEPTLENFAEYLAAFITENYPADKKCTLIAMSFSFLIVTRMLQLHPELTGRVELLVSFVGFLHRDDFHVAPPYYWTWRAIAALSGNRIGTAVWRHIILQPVCIRLAYTAVAKMHPKMKDASSQERSKRIDFETKLWRINDFRTRIYTLQIMLTANLCTARVAIPVYHVSVAHDFYFDNQLVEKHMREVYSDFKDMPAEVTAHAPTIIATAEQAAPFVPAHLRELLSR